MKKLSSCLRVEWRTWTGKTTVSIRGEAHYVLRRLAAPVLIAPSYFLHCRLGPLVACVAFFIFFYRSESHVKNRPFHSDGTNETGSLARLFDVRSSIFAFRVRRIPIPVSVAPYFRSQQTFKIQLLQAECTTLLRFL